MACERECKDIQLIGNATNRPKKLIKVKKTAQTGVCGTRSRMESDTFSISHIGVDVAPAIPTELTPSNQEGSSSAGWETK
jgi:hypothetical protein